MDVVEEDMERFEGEDAREMVHCAMAKSMNYKVWTQGGNILEEPK